jgi:hypothetical protein
MPAFNGIFQCGGNSILPYYRNKCRRPVFPGRYDKILHALFLVSTKIDKKMVWENGEEGRMDQSIAHIYLGLDGKMDQWMRGGMGNSDRTVVKKKVNF